MAGFTTLVEQARGGDHDAFDALATARVDQMYRAARLILREEDGAEDAVQEALVRAWRDLPSLRDVGRFDAWLHRLLVNACHDEGRRRRPFRSEIHLDGVEPAADDPDLRRVPDRDEIDGAFGHLSEAHRVVLALQHILGLSTAETTAVLGIPPGTVKSRTHFALDALRAALAAEARLGDPAAAGERAL
jgi:RNA polymerase sigma-70 factor, ECF subfamily